MSRYQKGKTNLDFTEARDSEWQWHQLGVYKSAPRSRQITMPAPHHSVFYMPFLPPKQQRQSTDGIYSVNTSPFNLTARLWSALSGVYNIRISAVADGAAQSLKNVPGGTDVLGK